MIYVYVHIYTNFYARVSTPCRSLHIPLDHFRAFFRVSPNCALLDRQAGFIYISEGGQAKVPTKGGKHSVKASYGKTCLVVDERGDRGVGCRV